MVFSVIHDLSVKISWWLGLGWIPRNFLNLEIVIDSRISRIWSRFPIWNVGWNISSDHQKHSDWLSRDDSFSSPHIELETEFLSSVFHFSNYGISDSQKQTFDFQYTISDNLCVSFDRSTARPPSFYSSITLVSKLLSEIQKLSEIRDLQ